MVYRLPQVPAGCLVSQALIVAPYFDRWFAERVVEQLRPGRIRFVVDDGAHDEDIKKLREACQDSDIWIALGRAAGIVHLKLYYFEFVTKKGGGIAKRLLIFGSANATQAAFGGTINAELFAEAEISTDAHAETLNYVASIAKAVESASGGRVQAVATRPSGNLPALHLPAFDVKPVGPPPGFDAWLQRGRLVAKYRDAQHFMAIAVKLNKNLPTGDVAKRFQAFGLIQQGARNVVRYRYVPQAPRAAGDKDGEEPKPKWKAQFCVWTHLGDWVSEECYQAKRAQMVSNSKSVREAAIQELLARREDVNWRHECKDMFIGAMDGVWQALAGGGVQPSDYLEGGGKGVNRAHYSHVFDRKLSADLVLAQDPGFYKRYINGYEFPEVPRFRQDAPAWEEFVRSFCESISVDAEKTKVASRITQVIRENLDPSDLSDLQPDEIADQLRKSWSGDSVGQPVWVLYDGDYFRATIKAVVRDSGKSLFTVEYTDGEVEQVADDRVWSDGYSMRHYFEDPIEELGTEPKKPRSGSKRSGGAVF